MDISKQPAVERVARVLAGQRISVNGVGEEELAAAQIEDRWRDFLPDAAAVLRTLREPDEAMAKAGDPAIWQAMILAAIDESLPDTVTL